MRQLGLGIFLLLCWLVAAPPTAHAEKRLALLIGNQSYSEEIGRLVNPHNDIALLEKTLKRLQFEVTSVRDASLGTMHLAVNSYARRVKAAGADTVAFFYYSGHGAADGGTNYLIPIDAKSVEEGDLWDESLRLTEITRKLKVEAGNAAHFVVFDACRSELKLRKAGTKVLVQARGFVPVPRESGMLIAYATAEGETASDVGVGAGPYSTVLAEEILKPGVEAVTMFRNVQRRVRLAINQEPYLGFNALGDVFLAGLVQQPVRLSEAAEAWNVAERTNSIRALEAFVRRFSDTYYADIAKERLAELKRAAEEASQAAERGTKRSEVEAAKKRGEAQVTKPEIVPAPLADEKTLREHLGVTWRRVCTQARSAEEAGSLLREKNIGFIQAVISSVVSWSPEVRCYNLTKPLLGAKLVEVGTKNDDLLAKVSRYGAHRCPWEVAVAARLSIADQPAGEAFRLVADPRGRQENEGGGYRVPYLGNGAPKAGAGHIDGRQYAGLFLTTSITSADYFNTVGFYVFCR